MVCIVVKWEGEGLACGIGCSCKIRVGLVYRTPLIGNMLPAQQVHKY